MSICPDRDIHSIYIDGELTSPYKEQYVQHISTCPKCRAELEKLRAVHNLLREDRENINFSDEQLDKGYEKLSTLLKFRNVTKKRTTPFNYVLKLGPAIAAALILAFVIPIRIGGNQTGTEAPLVATGKAQPKLFTERAIMVDDSFAKEVVTPILVSDVVSNKSKNNFGFVNLFLPDLDKTNKDNEFILYALPISSMGASATFNMYNNGNSMYNVSNTYTTGLSD